MKPTFAWENGRWVQWCGSRAAWVPVPCPMICPFVRRLMKIEKPRPKQPERDWPERNYMRERLLLRAEFPGLHDAELGLEPHFGWDTNGVGIY